MTGEGTALQEGGAGAPSAPGEEALRLEGLRHRFGRRTVLDEVSLTLRRGDFTVLLGQNGAGKTTLFALVTRLYTNQTGSIRVFGQELRRHPSRALARIGAVFQQRTLDLDLTVGQNLRYHAALHGLPRRLAEQRIAVELDRLGLADRLRERVRELSGGQARRVEIARALLHRPTLLLCDEASVGLDVDSRRTILAHLRRLVREERIALLWATHLVDEAEPGCRLAVLHQGRVRAEGEVGALLRDSACADVGSLFAALTGDGGRA